MTNLYKHKYEILSTGRFLYVFGDCNTKTASERVKSFLRAFYGWSSAPEYSFMHRRSVEITKNGELTMFITPKVDDEEDDMYGIYGENGWFPS